jgi:hypothetical protein
MGVLLHLFAVGSLLFNEVLARDSSSPGDCAGSQVCKNTGPYQFRATDAAERADGSFEFA